MLHEKTLPWSSTDFPQQCSWRCYEFVSPSLPSLALYYFSYLYINQTDPDGTMTWFLEQLEDAERHGDKVHVVAHIGGGDGEALEGWAINYYNAANRWVFNASRKKI